MKKRIEKGKKSGLIKKDSPDLKEDFREKEIKISFKDLDYEQGQTFKQWAEIDLIEEMVTRFKHYTGIKYKCAFNEKFKTYPTFPNNSKFKRSNNAPPDALWASMHIGNKPCVIGHFVENHFFILHLDKDHEFYITLKKHT